MARYDVTRGRVVRLNFITTIILSSGNKCAIAPVHSDRVYLDVAAIDNVVEGKLCCVNSALRQVYQA